MIKSYKNKTTSDAARGLFKKGFPMDIAKRVKMRLERIEAAVCLEDLKVPPSHRLEMLSGNRNGQYSIRVNRQWRICFYWIEGAAHEVELVDYH